MSYPNTPILFTSIQNQTNRFNYCHYGMANLSGGMVQITQINGVGLVTNGFVWQGPEIWFYPQNVDGISTGWAASAGYSGCVASSLISTSWTASPGYPGSSVTITTVWTASQSFGDEYPS